MRVFDFHAHLRPEPDSIEDYLSVMAKLGIESSVVLLGGSVDPKKLGGNVLSRPESSSASMFQNNEHLLELCGAYPQLFPFYFANPNCAADVKGFATLAARFHGLKLAPAVHGFSFLDPVVQELVATAQVHDLPVYSHVLATEGSDISTFNELAKQNPNVAFVLGHGGVGPLDFSAIGFIASTKNVFVETSGTFLATVAYAVKKVGVRRVVFGSEYPLQSAASELAKVADLNLAHDDAERVLFRNALSLLPAANKTRSSKLKVAVEDARRTPFYGKHLEGAKNDWHSIPCTTKEDLRDVGPLGLVSGGVEKQSASIHESSGSSGKPTFSIFGQRDWELIPSRFLRNAVNLTAEDWVLVKTPYSMATTAHQMHAAARMAGAKIVPASNRADNIDYPKVIRLLDELPITVCWSLPTELVMWARTARLLGFEPKRFSTLRAFVVAGEPLSSSRKAKLSSLWGDRPLFLDYGSTETGTMAGQCSHGFLHLWDDAFCLELRTEDGVVVAADGNNKIGEFVVTTLERPTSPLIRYVNGDYGEVLVEPCACGSERPRIIVRGRKADAKKFGQKLIFPKDVEEALFSHGPVSGEMLWRGRWSNSKLELEIDSAEAMSGLSDHLSKILGVSSGVRFNRDLLSDRTLLKAGSFSKPKYLFNENESWLQAGGYYRETAQLKAMEVSDA